MRNTHRVPGGMAEVIKINHSYSIAISLNAFWSGVGLTDLADQSITMLKFFFSYLKWATQKLPTDTKSYTLSTNSFLVLKLIESAKFCYECLFFFVKVIIWKSFTRSCKLFHNL